MTQKFGASFLFFFFCLNGCLLLIRLDYWSGEKVWCSACVFGLMHFSLLFIRGIRFSVWVFVPLRCDTLLGAYHGNLMVFSLRSIDAGIV